MLRIALFYLLPFLLPFIGYFLYRFLVTRGQPLLQSTPWFILSVIGLLLVIASLFSLAFIGDGAPDGVYVPPHMEDGRLVPGRVLRPGEGTAGDAGG